MEKYNAKCDICGKEYNICSSCPSGTKYNPWRHVVDILPHYAIFLALSEYTATKDKVKAKANLDKCDLSKVDTFTPSTQKAIKEIYAEVEKVIPKTTIKNKNTATTNKNTKVVTKEISKEDK